MMKNNNVRKKDYLILTIFYIAIFCILYFLKEEYFFGWLVHNKTIYIGLFIITMIMISIGARKLAYCTFAGNLIGIILGQFLGNLFQSKNMAKIEPGMSEQMRYQLSSGKHVFIWATILIVFIILGLILDSAKNSKN